MKIVVSGASGLVGKPLLGVLRGEGHEVTALTRGSSSSANSLAGVRTINWNPDSGQLDGTALEGLDAVVHLAGENIAVGRWTAAKKARIRDSRVNGTQVLARTLASLQHKPSTLVCASAIGFYGNRGDEVLREDAVAGTGFLADVCRDWEMAAAPAVDAGIRVVWLRIGVILAREGGALAKMLLPFRMGVGGILGSGKQFMSWISVTDVVGIISFVLNHSEARGPHNTTAPQPVTNYEFTKTLGKVLGRPTIFPMPAFAVNLVFGEMGQELLLSSTRVVPSGLEAAGYSFQHPTLEIALKQLLTAK